MSVCDPRDINPAALIHGQSLDRKVMMQTDPRYRPKVMSPDGEQIGEVLSMDWSVPSNDEEVALDRPLGTEITPDDEPLVVGGPFFHEGSVTTHPMMKIKIDPDSETFKKIKESKNMSVSMSVPVDEKRGDIDVKGVINNPALYIDHSSGELTTLKFDNYNSPRTR